MDLIACLANKALTFEQMTKSFSVAKKHIVKNLFKSIASAAFVSICCH